MIAIPLDKLAYIVEKAREFDVEVEPDDEMDGSNPTDDDARAILEDTPDNPSRQELVDAIDSLNDAERVELLALVWLGRGDYDRKEWHDALRAARDAHNRRETDYLVGTPLLADYIEEGLAVLGTSLEGEEIGRL